MEEEDNNFIEMLPPEILTMIFENLDQKQVVQLRLVSKTWKNVIDHHQIFIVKMNGSKPSSIPNPDVKIGELCMKNFVSLQIMEQFPLSSNQLRRLYSFTLTGMCHLQVVQKVLEDAINLMEFKMSGTFFKFNGIDSPSSSLSLNGNVKLETIRIQKQSVLQPQFAPTNQIVDEIMSIQRFIKILPMMLNPSLILPILTTLVLEYHGLPLLSLQNLVLSTIIPFVQRHTSSLKVLHIMLVPPEDTPSGGIIIFPDQQQGGPCRPPALVSLGLRLPDAVLNGTIIAIFNNMYNNNKASQPSLEHLLCEWEKPYQSNPQQEEISYTIIQNLIYANQEQLFSLYMDNFNSNSTILCNGGGAHNFKKMEELTVGGRNKDGFVQRNEIIMYQVKLLGQVFSMLKEIHLYDMPLKLTLFIKNIMLHSFQLESLTLSGNNYYNNVKVDEEILTCLARKQGLKDVAFGNVDLINVFVSDYWDNFKSVFGLQMWEVTDDNNGIVLRF